MITTSANRVKHAKDWCGLPEQVAQVDLFLEERNYNYDTEVEIKELLTPLGLASTLHALGHVHPRYETKAEQLVTAYILNVYDEAARLAASLFLPTSAEARRAICSPAREALAAQTMAQWAETKVRAGTPAERILCRCMMWVFSKHKRHLIAVNATKELLLAKALVSSNEDCARLYERLVDGLRKFLEAA